MAKNTNVAKSETSAPVLFDPTRLKKVGDVVIPSLSIKNMKEGDTLYIRVESEIRKVHQTDEVTGEMKVNKKSGQPELLPIIIAVNMATGQRGQMVLPAIVFRGLEAMGTLQGRMFGLQKGASLGTGKANLWEVVELAEGDAE